MDDIEAVGRIIGITLEPDEYTACLDALNTENYYEAAAKASVSENHQILNKKVGKNVAQKFYSLTNFVAKEADVASITKLFYEAETGLDISHAVRAAYHLRRRTAFTKLTATKLLKRFPWILLQIIDEKEIAAEAAQAIEKFCNIPKDTGMKERIAGQIISFLMERMRQGDSFTYSSVVYSHMLKNYSIDAVNSALGLLTTASPFSQVFGKVVRDKRFINEVVNDTGRFPYQDTSRTLEKVSAFYLPGIFFSEVDAAKGLVRIHQSAMEAWNSQLILKYCDKDLDKEQIEFIQAVGQNKITILTGEAGTGKTKALKNLINGCGKAYNFIPVILGPTALSAYNAAYDTIGEEEAQTIHRYSSIFNEESDLAVDIKGLIAATQEDDNLKMPRLVIVDEAEMKGPVMLRKLLNTITDDTRLVFSGDPAQLPPIGAAGIFTALIDLADNHNFGKHIELKTNHRSDESIIKVARNIRKGLPIEFNDIEIKFIPTPNNKLVETCISTVKELLHGNSFSDEDLIILAPTRTKTGGTNILNQELRKEFGSGEKIPDTDFNIADSVVARRNDYVETTGMVPRSMREIRTDRGDVYNGMRGKIFSFDADTTIVTVGFNLHGKIQSREYMPEELSYYLEPAYAMTTHKVIGSQAKNIVVVLGTATANRSLIYTAHSRCVANGTVIFIAEPEFADAPYADKHWEELLANDTEAVLPATKCLSKFKYRVLDEMLAYQL